MRIRRLLIVLLGVGTVLAWDPTAWSQQTAPPPESEKSSSPDSALTAPQEILTNDLVIKLVKAGLSEGVIIEKIQATPSKFELGTDGLIALKQAGVPDRVIEAMVRKSRPPGMGAVPSGSTPGPSVEATTPQAVGPMVPALGFGLFGLFSPQPVQVKDTVIYVRDGKPIELDFVRGRVKQSGFIVYTSKMVLHDARAQLRITEERPTFYVGANPTEVFLVRFKSDPEDNDRTLTVGKAQFWGYWTEVKQYIDTDDTIPIDFEKLPSGYYRVIPKRTLPKGEYGFLREGAGRVYDFGRD
jgi:hypothetical protein